MSTELDSAALLLKGNENRSPEWESRDESYCMSPLTYVTGYGPMIEM